MRIVLADNNPERRGQLRRVLLGQGLQCDAADAVSSDQLPARLAQAEHDLVLVTCDGPLDDCLIAIRAAHQSTTAPVLAAGSLRDAGRVRQIMAAGAREYLAWDRLRDELATTVERLETEGAIHQQRGVVISVFSPSGGAGVSTTAINLAVGLARRQVETALVDLQPAPSDLALLLDLEPRYTLDELAPQWERLDRQMLTAAMTSHGSGLHVLAQSGFPEMGGTSPSKLSPASVRQIVLLLRRTYAFTVLDLDHTFAHEQLEAMRLSNFVTLVARPDVPGLRRARWALDTAAQFGLPRDRFRLVLNRCGGRGRVSIAQAEEMLGVSVIQAIPDDQATMLKATNQGIPVADLSRLSRISRSFSSLARHVQPRDKKATV